MIAKSLKVKGIPASDKNGLFTQMCQDVLASETSRVGSKSSQTKVKETVRELVTKYC
jgi:nitric oxide reductase NorQ protein